MKKILIIKLGYSETLDSMLSLSTSLGDVLRTTVILHFFKGAHITWLVDEKARPLLENNKCIDRLWNYDPDTTSKLKKERFDIIVNFEKLPEICALSDSLRAEEYFGFRSNALNDRLTDLTKDLNRKRENKDCWQKILAGALGKEWDGEDYILGYEPRSEIEYDIGFNWTVGNKWTNKAWPKSYWEDLETLLKDKYSVSWQRGLSSLHEYIDWINSCKLIVTADTLGLHLGLVMQKRIVVLFGPTSSSEVYFYDRGSFLLPEAPYECIPCLKSYCDKERQCMEYITPQRVMERIEDEFEKTTIASKI